MKYSMLQKHITIYLTVALLSLVAVSFACYRIDYKKVYDYYTDVLYSEATEIADTYARVYLNDTNLATAKRELTVIANVEGITILFIKPNGDVIMDTSYSGRSKDDGILYSVEDFDYGSLNGAHSDSSTFYGIFREKHLNVYAPITSSFTLKGYVVVSMPESVIQDRVYTTFNTNYLTLIIVLLLATSFPLLYYFSVHKPIAEIIKATNEYGKGNFAYKLKAHKNDELGRLEASLNYMASELDEMNKFQQKFLSNVSHDFRSPLTSIKGYLEAMQDGTIPPEMMNKYFDIVLFETERLTKLTSNILTLNELDPKTVRLDKSTFDLNSIIRHTIETMEGNCKKKNIKFSLTFAGSQEMVVADKGKIEQVIYNLIDNAIKFSHENSYVYITVREKGDKAHISVKDTGSGIAKEDIDKIWNRFYKSDSSRGRDKKGSGLGLSITKEIIQAHNEQIDVISTVGVGTEFIFTLPLDKAQ
ncbi:MAG: ATP-binding protein [Lachnospira sp.]